MAGVGPADLHAAAVALLAAAVEALDTTATGAPERQVVSPGRPPADCEQVAVHVEAISEANVERSSRTNQLAFVVTVYRCVPVPSSSMKMPSAAKITEAGEVTNADAWALWNHLWNMYRAGCLFRECRQITMAARALEQQGGFGGWRVTLGTHLDGYEETIVCSEE